MIPKDNFFILNSSEVSKEWKTRSVKTETVRMEAKIGVKDGCFETYAWNGYLVNSNEQKNKLKYVW